MTLNIISKKRIPDSISETKDVFHRCICAVMVQERECENRSLEYTTLTNVKNSARSGSRYQAVLTREMKE
jgi:hypothetical protein